MPSIISQDLLEEYCQALQAEDEAKATRSQLRTHILDLAEDGATVESGQLKLSIVERGTQTLTWGKLEAILDEDEIEYLRDEVPPTVCKYVYVRPSHTAAQEPSFSG